MYAWWAIRAVERAGWLTSGEWGLLIQQGQTREFARGERLTWGPGVLLISQGQVRLGGAGGWLWKQQADTHVQQGDIAGIHPGTLGTIFAEMPSTLHLFPHGEWLHALWHHPQLTTNLLRGMARAALQAEQQAPPSE